MTLTAEKARRYQRRVLWVVAAVLVWFGIANLVSPIGSRVAGAIMLAIGLFDVATLRYLP